jgi:hypothetical protein
MFESSLEEAQMMVASRVRMRDAPKAMNNWQTSTKNREQMKTTARYSAAILVSSETDILQIYTLLCNFNFNCNSNFNLNLLCNCNSCI